MTYILNFGLNTKTIIQKRGYVTTRTVIKRLFFYMIFTELASRPVQSISCDIRLCACFCVCAIAWDQEQYGLEDSGQRAHH